MLCIFRQPPLKTSVICLILPWAHPEIRTFLSAFRPDLKRDLTTSLFFKHLPPPSFKVFYYIQSAIAMKSAILLCVFVAVLFDGARAQGKIAPLLPEEYACNFVQTKWNYNGFVVNHTLAGVQYSSYSQQFIRTDGGTCDLYFVFNSLDSAAFDVKSDNHSDPSPIWGFVTITVFDFNTSKDPSSLIKDSKFD
jgi:hypothetical protein